MAKTLARVTVIERHARYLIDCSHPGCWRFASYKVTLPGDVVVWKCLNHLPTHRRARS